MTQLREIAYLELDTFSLAGTSDINANKTNWIFRNVNLRNVMGDMWDRYDKFIIKLQQLNTTGTQSFPSGSAIGMIAYNMAGLDWINIYFETGGSIQKWAPITQIVSSTSAPNQEFIYPNGGFGINFRKGQPIVDLEFQIYPITSSNFNVNTTDTFNNNQMTLTIEPAEDNENEMGVMILNTQTAITTPGKIASSGSNIYTYYNFNIKDVCREFWDKYDDYEIAYPNYVAGGLTTTIPQAAQNVAMKGFDFMNNSMGIGNGNFVTDIAVLASNRYGNTGTTSTSDYMLPARVQFKKSNATMTLELQFRTYDNSEVSTVSVSRRYQGMFFIKPIRKELGCCEKGTLVLSGAGMTTTPTNFGVTNANVTNTTWRNINLRNACRGFWDKYTKFNIFLSQSQNNVTTTDSTEQALVLYMSGLNFETPWNVNPNVGSQVWTVGGIMFGHTITTQAIFAVTNGNTKGIMFHKTSDVVDINMYVQTLDNTALAATGCLNGTFIFTIVGVEE